MYTIHIFIGSFVAIPFIYEYASNHLNIYLIHQPHPLPLQVPENLRNL